MTVHKPRPPFKAHDREPQVTVACRVCGRQFQVDARWQDRAKYCSTRCRLSDEKAGGGV